jgi:site-specific DNA recombinase
VLRCRPDQLQELDHRRIGQVILVQPLDIRPQDRQGLGDRRDVAASDEQRQGVDGDRHGLLDEWRVLPGRADPGLEFIEGLITWGKTREIDRGGRRRAVKRPASEWVTVPVPALRIVSDELWAQVAARLADTKAAALRTSAVCKDGKTRRGLLAGSLTYQGNGKREYLLTGIAKCGICRGGLQIRKRFITVKGRTRKVEQLVYECATRRFRGIAVCANRTQVDLLAADRTVLHLIDDAVLNPAVMTTVLRETLQRLAATSAPAQTDRAGLTQTLRKLDQQRENLTTAIAEGGERFAAIHEKLAEVERQTATARGRLAHLDRLLALDQINLDKLDTLIRLKLKDFSGLIGRHPAQAKTIIRKFLAGPLIFTPGTARDGAAKITITGEATGGLLLSAALAALVPSAQIKPDGVEFTRWWPQRDSNPCFSLERAVS